MKKIAYDNLKLDQLQIIEDGKRYLKVNAVITREGVYQYPDGLALKSRPELLKATRTARTAKLTIRDHPDSLVVMSQSQMKGRVEKPFFDRDRIRAVLSFDKLVCPTDFVESVRTGNLKDVSIGFYYQPDVTPGVWHDRKYDYVMRDIVIDHVAAGVFKGRCTFPNCGIGVDVMMRRIALDPFGDYTDFADCVSKNQKKKNPEAFCAWLHKRLTGKTPAEDHVNFKGGKKTMSEHKTQEELEAEFNECVRKMMEEGAVNDPPMTRERAEEECVPATEPEDEPGPVPEHLDQDETFEACVKRKMEEGKSRETAEQECRGEHPVAEEDDEPEPTPLEKCIQGRIETEGESEEEARRWCLAELAGEHEEVGDMLQRSKKLIAMRSQRNIARRKRQRQHPV